MELFHRILRAAVEGGASDVHLKIGSPVTLRVNRQLLSIAEIDSIMEACTEAG